MKTTIKIIKEWLERGKAKGATHVIVVCDTFDYEDYPVMVKPKEDVHKIEAEYRAKSMQKVMEVYNLNKDLEKQLDPGDSIPSRRNFNY